MNSHVGAIRACKYLYLHSVSEPEENSLRVVLHEAKVGGPPTAEQLAQEALPSVRELLAGSNAIVHGPGCQVFELVWPSYIGYPFPFHPLDLGEEALKDRFGYQLEGVIDASLLEPESIPLVRYKRSGASWWKFW